MTRAGPGRGGPSRRGGACGHGAAWRGGGGGGGPVSRRGHDRRRSRGERLGFAQEVSGGEKLGEVGPMVVTGEPRLAALGRVDLWGFPAARTIRELLHKL